MIIQRQDYFWQRILVKPNCFKSKYYIEEKMQGANNRYIFKTIYSRQLKLFIYFYLTAESAIYPAYYKLFHKYIFASQSDTCV